MEKNTLFYRFPISQAFDKFVYLFTFFNDFTEKVGRFHGKFDDFDDKRACFVRPYGASEGTTVDIVGATVKVRGPTKREFYGRRFGIY